MLSEAVDQKLRKLLENFVNFISICLGKIESFPVPSFIWKGFNKLEIFEVLVDFTSAESFAVSVTKNFKVLFSFHFQCYFVKYAMHRFPIS